MSLTIWLFYNLSRKTTGVVERVVVASSNIAGRSAVSSSSYKVEARCNASGFALLRCAMRKRPVVVDFDASDLKYDEGDNYYVLNTSLYKYTKSIFSDKVEVDMIISQNPVFRFNEERYVKVPVRAVADFDFREQYMPSSPISLSPDSVLVYGEPESLCSVEYVCTRTVAAKDIHVPVSGKVKLEKAPGLRYSAEEISYSLDVVRFVEISSRVGVSVRNLPSGVSLQVLPSVVKASFRCAFPVSSNPFDSAEFYVDYREFEKSTGGNCVVRVDNVPGGVIDCRIFPDVCECVEYQK